MTSTFGDSYWEQASSCYNYLTAVAPSTFAASYSSALNDMCKPPAKAGFGGSSVPTTVSGGAGQTASPSSTSSNPRKTNGASSAQLSSWGVMMALTAIQAFLT